MPRNTVDSGPTENNSPPEILPPEVLLRQQVEALKKLAAELQRSVKAVEITAKKIKVKRSA